ncbi:MAG: TraR/DksA C4-type zinc finger protein [Patescibacteria group bacterium]
MDKNFQRQKTELEKEKVKLLKDIAAAEMPEDFGSDVDDYDEEKNEAESLGNKLATAHVLRTRISEINSALDRISNGSYGVCEACGKTIEEKVLEISPESRLCQQCKKGK